MPLLPIAGHQPVRARLLDAVNAGRLPQVLLLSGPPGVGRQRLALWLAQAVLCRTPESRPCGRCRDCRLVLDLAHSDLHWFVPIARPKATDPARQVDEAAEAIAEIMAERRAQPLYAPPDGMASHSIATVRLLQRRASLTAVEGGARIFILGDAERLVAQESNQEAANALLKLLEEPPPGTVFILTAVDSRRLLPTMRSRAVAIRLGRLSDAEVRDFLGANLSPPLDAPALEARVALAGGAIGAAVAAGDDAGKAQQAASQWLEAILEGRGSGLERAMRQPAWSARGEFTALLDALSDTLGEAVRGAMGETVRRPVPTALLRYRSPARLLDALGRIATTREAAHGNVNPQILLAVLGEDLAEVL
ncbi:MAG: hypothetical protein H0W67_05830 [Gemmatimonadales bacterium]|nr:hypothetical protein [Gemmatimonadales bacterium]